LKLIGLISDTHIPARARLIPRKVFKAFQNTTAIIHAGDLTRLSVIEELEQMAPVIAAHGNMDTKAVKEKIPATNSFDIYDWKIGVTHSLNYFRRRNRLENAAEEGFNVFVCGHTHQPSLKYKQGMLMINPGSPTDPIPPFLTRPSIALLRISKKEIEPRILTL